MHRRTRGRRVHGGTAAFRGSGAARPGPGAGASGRVPRDRLRPPSLGSAAWRGCGGAAAGGAGPRSLRAAAVPAAAPRVPWRSRRRRRRLRPPDPRGCRLRDKARGCPPRPVSAARGSDAPPSSRSRPEHPRPKYPSPQTLPPQTHCRGSAPALRASSLTARIPPSRPVELPCPQPGRRSQRPDPQPRTPRARENRRDGCGAALSPRAPQRPPASAACTLQTPPRRVAKHHRYQPPTAPQSHPTKAPRAPNSRPCSAAPSVRSTVPEGQRRPQAHPPPLSPRRPNHGGAPSRAPRAALSRTRRGDSGDAGGDVPTR